ncbi:MAG: hypothetical protein SNF33_00305 (plasmid) [Candidatus Algichlamydia australiensis]|nr:hypothetical protein [Chlamydiales bacterium]
MSTKSSLSRMTIDLPAEDHKRLKTLAAILGKTMRELVAEWIHGNLYTENSPNATTMKAIENVENETNLVECENEKDFFDKLGL